MGVFNLAARGVSSQSVAGRRCCQRTPSRVVVSESCNAKSKQVARHNQEHPPSMCQAWTLPEFRRTAGPTQQFRSLEYLCCAGARYPPSGSTIWKPAAAHLRASLWALKGTVRARRGRKLAGPGSTPVPPCGPPPAASGKGEAGSRLAVCSLGVAPDLGAWMPDARLPAPSDPPGRERAGGRAKLRSGNSWRRR